MARRIIDPDIDLPVPLVAVPMLPGEKEQRYESRCVYLALGPGRSLAAVSRLFKARFGKGSPRLFELWSAQDGWAETARWYDEEVQAAAAKVAQEQYLAQIVEHQSRYYQAGLQLYDAAISLLDEVKIKIKTMELTPASLRHVALALASAADLEAHALNIAQLHAKIEQVDEEDL